MVAESEYIHNRNRKWLRCLLWFIGAILLLFLAGHMTAPAAALPGNMVVNTYYSDADFTNQVGFQVVLRCGGTSGPLHGQPGEYTKQETIKCVDYIVINRDCYFTYIHPPEDPEDPNSEWEIEFLFPVTCPNIPTYP